MADERESFDPTPFITLLDEFPTKEFKEILRKHKWPQGDKKFATLKSKVTALLRDPTKKGQAASATILYYKQNVLCPFNVSKIKEEETKQQIITIAQRITDELDIGNVTAKFNDEGLMVALLSNCKFYFDKAFLAACNNKLSAIKLIEVSGVGWNNISKESQQKWQDYYLKYVELHAYYLRDGGKTAVVEKKKLSGGDVEIVLKCCFCFNSEKKTNNSYQHIRVIHYPDWQTKPRIKSQCEAVITSMKSDPHAVEFHAKMLSIWQSLWSDRIPNEHAKLIKNVGNLFKELMKNDKNATVYVLTQLCKDYKLVENCDLSASIFRYVGKHLAVRDIRHFKSVGIARGNVSREITKLIQKHLPRKNFEIQQSDRLYGWYALKCPEKSLKVLEMSIIMAMWHLTKNDSSKCWNMELNAIPKHKSLRNHDPEELVILGLYSLKQIVKEFNKQTQLGQKAFFSSSELLSIYDSFNEQDRASFNARYKITESAINQINDLKDINAERLDKLCVAAKRLKDADLLEDCRRLEAKTLKALGTRVESVEGSDDVEMVDNE